MVSGTLTTLQTNTDATSTQDTWYDMIVRCHGSDVTVYRMEHDAGGEITEVLSTSNTGVTTARSVNNR